MARIFNVNGACKPSKHYMVNLDSRLEAVKAMVDAGEYFTINKARQYGKTTLLRALTNYLKKNYIVVSMDFQRMSASRFETESIFSVTFAQDFIKKIKSGNRISEEILSPLNNALKEKNDMFALYELFEYLSDICSNVNKPIVLMIDEVDTATNNQVFLDFLAQLRAYYIDSDVIPTFQSVILAGVHDVRNIKRKIRSADEHKTNSPWNIAADFEVEMSFSPLDIAGMLNQYEADCHTGMDIGTIADLIYKYTSGYPYLVSRLCKLLDEKISGSAAYPDKSSAWTKAGFLDAEKMLVGEDNSLYQSLIRKLEVYPELKSMLYELLFNGKSFPYTATNACIKDAAMFGFIRKENGSAIISNRIFETVLYNHFISEELTTSKMYSIGVQEKNQFIIGGHLNVRRILEKFVETFGELYGEKDDDFLENVGRKYFILFLKPIINGIGNYSIEPQTRDSDRMDLVIYYHGEQHILELKIWRGNAYHERGEKQLSEYLDYFNMKKGYMLSFNFNKKKVTGLKEIQIGDKVLIEAVV